MMRSTGLVRRLALFAAVFVLAGCESAPRAPLMSPYSDEIGFGYSERELSDRRFEVRYLTPTRRTWLNPDKRESEAEETRERSYDLALWRAAELVLEKGFAAFAVTTSRTDVEVEIVEEVPYFFDYGLVHPFSIRPLGGYRSFDYYGASIRSAWLTARARLVIVIEERKDTLDAAATAARLKDKYPEALLPGAY